MDGDARELVHRLKYDGLSAMGEPMAALMLAEAHAQSFGVTIVVPVPLHRGRERSRGYNQSRLLAAPIARALGLPLDARAVRRTRATAPLANAMDRDERRRIVAGAFAADPTRATGQHVLLVDDVTTTGATLDACAAALLDAGAATVRCLTFARTG
jgi:ComF family protein